MSEYRSHTPNVPRGIRYLSLYMVVYGCICVLRLLGRMVVVDASTPQGHVEHLLLFIDSGVFVIFAATGVGLWRLKTWAWQSAIVLYSVGALASLGLLNPVSVIPGFSLRFSLLWLGNTPVDSVELIFHLGVLWYLARTKIRTLFGRPIWWKSLNIRCYLRSLKMPGLLSGIPLGDGYRTVITLGLMAAALWAAVEILLGKPTLQESGQTVEAFVILTLFHWELVVLFGGFVSGILLHAFARWRGGTGSFEASIKIAFMAAMLAGTGASLVDIVAVGLLGISKFDSNSAAMAIGGIVEYEGLRFLHQMDRKATWTALACLYGTVILVAIVLVLGWTSFVPKPRGG